MCFQEQGKTLIPFSAKNIISAAPFAVTESGVWHSQDIMCLLIFPTIGNEVCFTLSLCSFGYCSCSLQLQRKSTADLPASVLVPSYSSPQGCEDGATPRECSKISSSWHTRGMFTMSVTPRGKTEEPKPLRPVTVPCPLEACQCLSV